MILINLIDKLQTENILSQFFFMQSENLFRISKCCNIFSQIKYLNSFCLFGEFDLLVLKKSF